MTDIHCPKTVPILSHWLQKFGFINSGALHKLTIFVLNRISSEIAAFISREPSRAPFLPKEHSRLLHDEKVQRLYRNFVS